MCGIVGYAGKRRVVPVLIEGLKKLEYRGYDSAGIVYLKNGELETYRCEGKLAKLEALVEEAYGVQAYCGLGHTRWATHGAPTENNAHPHRDCSGRLVVVHNGIIENYHSLREELKQLGHQFNSETDTEVLAHLIEENLDNDLAAAVQKSLERVEGSYALGVMSADFPGILVAARNHSPLVLGTDDQGNSYLASDTPALLPYTDQVIFLEDREMAILSDGDRKLISLETGETVQRDITTIEWNAAMAEKAGFKHFMLKEIFEQPQAITNTISGRINLETGNIVLPEINLDSDEFERIERIFLVACGTSWHAALVAKYWLEKYVRIPVEVDIASEFRYRHLLIDERVLTISISQSGETADTLAGIRRAAEMGSRVLTICNVVGSTMTREADGTIYTHAGPEIGVASTKAFISQLAALFLFTLYFAQMRNSISIDERKKLGQHLIDSAGVVEQILPIVQKQIRALIESFYDCRDFLFIGRGVNFPIALEGA